MRVVGGQRERQQPLPAPAAQEPTARLAGGGGALGQRALAQAGQQAGGGDHDEGHEDRRRAVAGDAEAAGHPHEPADEQQPERLGQPEPGAGQPPQDERGERRGGQPDRLDEREEAERLEHALGAEASGRSGGAPRRRSQASTRMRVFPRMSPSSSPFQTSIRCARSPSGTRNTSFTVAAAPGARPPEQIVSLPASW